MCITESLYILNTICITLLYTGNIINQPDFCKKLKCKNFGGSLVVQLLGLHAFAAWVRFLVRELGVHKLCGMIKKKKRSIQFSSVRYYIITTHCQNSFQPAELKFCTH